MAHVVNSPAPEVSQPPAVITAFAPGRVNLIGDHTDYTGGLAMPIALDLGTEISYVPDPSSSMIELSSSIEDEAARVPLSISPGTSGISTLTPFWARYVAAIASVVRPPTGGRGTITTTLPVGAGLSSSAALQVATALALGFNGPPEELAIICRDAEMTATGVATGILDQLAITLAVPGHALLIDCNDHTVTPVPIPEGAEFLIAHCGVPRSVAGSGYAERRSDCMRAEQEIGPLRFASPFDVDRLRDPVLRKRARHVVSENSRVRQFARSLEIGNFAAAGKFMNDSHSSLVIDFEVSIPELDELVARLQAMKGVYGARLTGAGWGGCAVALVEKDAIRLPIRGINAWFAVPSGAACLKTGTADL